MLVIGDLACPICKEDELISSLSKFNIFRNQLMLINLEGLFSHQSGDLKDPSLQNSLEVCKHLSSSNTLIASIANNHTCDYPERIEETCQILKENNIKYFGLYEDDGKILPAEVEWQGVKYAFFGHCWCVYTQTNTNTANNKRIVDCQYDEFIDIVSEYCSEHKDTRVITYFHWNYDLEILPFAMHRLISRKLIDNGVWAVMGNHSHVPQGGEMYKGHPIVYGFGNFYIPSGFFFDGQLEYGNESKKTMVLEIEDNLEKCVCHWLKTDADNSLPLEFITSEDFSNGEMIQAYSPYRKMTDKEYRKYFSKNRRKRMLVPIYNTYFGSKYKLCEKIAIYRIKIIKLLSNFLK